MKMKKIGIAAFLTVAATCTLASCNKTDDSDKTESIITVPDGFKAPDSAKVDLNFDTATDAMVYDAAFGDYEENYNLALKAKNTNERYYYFAKAEASALANALFLPTNSKGGNYAISRVAPGSGHYSLWGYSEDNYDSVVVANEFIKKEDIETLKAKRDAAREKNATYKVYSDGTHTTTYDPVKELTALGYTINKTYSLAKSAFPQQWDITSTYRSTDFETIVNCYAGLINYDNSGAIVPGIAKSWSVSEDGLTWTFNLRQDSHFYDSAKEDKGEITAQAFVDGIQRAGAAGQTSYMLAPIEGYDECADTDDWTKLNVKAVDNYTLQFKLSEKCDYFLTYLTYAPFNAINKAYVEQQGEAYGTAYNKILYTGAYITTSYSDKSMIVLTKNENYWNAANVTNDTINVIFDDNSNPQATYERATKGTTSGVGLNTTRLELAKGDGNFDKYAYVVENTSASYFANFNYNRKSYQTEYDTASTTSAKTADEKSLSKTAIMNANFRRSILAAFDKKKWSAVQVGDDLALAQLRNLYTPYDYISLTETTEGYAAGTQYGAIVEGELKKLTGIQYDLKDGRSSFYNEDLAKIYIDKAFEELGLSDKDKIVIDYAYAADVPSQTASAAVIKESIEDATGGKVQVNLVAAKDATTWYYMGYYTDDAKDVNYDFCAMAGWSPDFGDPLSYLSTLGPAGDMINLFGINQHESTKNN